MSPKDALLDVAARLRRLGVRFALVGGLAVSLRAEVRFTRDVDLALAVDSDAEAKRVSRALAAEGFALVAVVEQDERKRIARLRSPSGIVIDLLTASSGIEQEIVAAGVTPEFPDVPVATSAHLVAMKVLSMRDARLQDRIDARSLLLTGPVDHDEVSALLSLIEGRGFARGQDLHVKFAQLLSELAA
jgi:hypothetical protein